MTYVYLAMFIAGLFGLFFTGFFTGVIKEKMGRHVLLVVPVFIAILLFNVVWAILEMGRAGRW